MITHVAHRHALARSLVTVALPLLLLVGATDAGATSISAAHAPGGVVHVAIARFDESQTVTISRSVGLMTGATGVERQAELGAAPRVTRSVGLMEGASGAAGQDDLGASPFVSRSVGLMDGAHR